MKFYLFISYLVWLFGAFTIIFVLSRTSDTIFIVIPTLLIASSFLIFIFYKVTHMYSEHFSTHREQARMLIKQKSKLKVLDQMKVEFVSIASHQLRNPLTSIRGYTSMLLEGSYGKLPKKAVVAIEKISHTSESMAKTVEDYLTVSRIEAGSVKYNPIDFNLKTEVEHLVDEHRAVAMKRGLLLTFKSDLESGAIVHADVKKIHCILDHLLHNAFCYTTKGMVTVFVHDTKKKIFVDVIDTGIGMDNDDLEYIFEKFQRAGNAPDVDVKGNGLGLFVSKKIAQQMKGDITAYSKGVHEGSTFRLTLPMQM